MQPLCARFVVGSHAQGDFKYVGLHMVQHTDRSVSIDLDDYIESMDIPTLKRSKEDLSSVDYTSNRSLVGELN